MRILKEERVVALNDAIGLCLDAANLYETAADQTERGGLADELRTLAARRRRDAQALSEEVRRLDELPSDAPQEERQLLEQAAQQLRASLAEATDTQIRRDCRLKEEQIEAAAEAVLRHDLSDRARDAATALARDAATSLPG